MGEKIRTRTTEKRREKEEKSERILKNEERGCWISERYSKVRVGFLSLIICIILIFDDCGVLVLGLESFRLIAII